jgi:hypothetical protein
MFQGKVKKSEKLPRGSYFYLRVGGRLYAGEGLNVQEEPPSPYGHEYAHYVGQKKAKPDGSRMQRWGMWAFDDVKPRPRKQTVVGKHPMFTDEFKEVKKFRRLNQAEAACERLKVMYADLGIRVTIELHEGEK